MSVAEKPEPFEAPEASESSAAASRPAEPIPEPSLYSPSVGDLATDVTGEVTATDLVEVLLRSHEYAGRAPSTFTLRPASAGASRRAVSDWLSAVTDLYQREAVPELVGRHVVLGLALLELDLWIDLSRDDFIDKLQSETYGLRKDGAHLPWEEILSPAGVDRLKLARANRDNVRLLSDRPAFDDLLGRKPFAEALAIRLRRIWAQDVRPIGAREARESPHRLLKRSGAAYMVNMHGPWGSGKTSILNFLDQSLRASAGRSSGSAAHQPDAVEQRPWVVVWFNAWQHQRLGLPWWWLMNEVFRTGWRQVFARNPLRALSVFGREYAWRVSVRRLPELLTAILVIGFLWLAVYFGLLERVFHAPLSGTGAAADSLSRLLAIAISVVTTIYGLAKLLELQSARSARQFIDTARDPMRAISDHFVELTRWMGTPVAVFVDDLDRCQSEFVLEFLEGVQTLFIGAPVLYVVSAERRWLRACYENAYAKFANTVEVTGRPLGYHFLEKVFQLSVPVPEMPPAMRMSYFKSLVSRQEVPGQKEMDRYREAARVKADALKDDRQISEASRASAGNTLEDRIFRGELARRLAEGEVEIGITHKLLDFEPLMEPNPRAMKSLVNTYGVLKTIAVLNGVDVGMELALWAIVSMRWPVLAEYLAASPNDTDSLIKFQPPAVLNLHVDGELLRQQFMDPNVAKVFAGAGTGVSLDADKVMRCSSLFPTQRAAEPMPPRKAS